MPISILVLKEDDKAYDLSNRLQEALIPIVNIELIEPPSRNNLSSQELKQNFPLVKEEKGSYFVKRLKIDDVKLLNPKISSRNRQKLMAFWLMPFGLIAGITFSGMTDLNTFSRFGFNSYGEIIISGLLGMGSGLIGSFFAASSVNPYKKDIESLRKRNEQGQWLLLLQTPFETDLPWQIIREIDPIEVVQINEF